MRGKLNSLESPLAFKTDNGGRLSSKERRVGGSVVGRPGGIRGGILVADVGLRVVFSGLLGGVLNGDTSSSVDAISARGASVLVSGCENIAGLAGILGFSPRFAGGGIEVLFNLRSSGLPFPLNGATPGDNRCAVSATGTDDPSFVGVIGRCTGGGGTLVETDSLELCIELLASRLSSWLEDLKSRSGRGGGE